MNLFSDLEKIVKQHLTTIGVPIPAAPDIEALMLLALNHEMKAVSQQPRTVHCSKEFSAKRSGLPLAQKEAVGCIFEKLEKGEDVNGHLSRSSAKPAETDPLLADWKIHHLHISNHKECCFGKRA